MFFLKRFVPIYLFLICGVLTSCISNPVYFNKTEIIRGKSRIAILPFRDYNAKEGNNSGILVRNVFETRLRARGYKTLNFEKSYSAVPETMYSDFHLSSKWIMENREILGADYVLYGYVYDYTVFQNTSSFLYIFSWLETTYSVGITAKLVSCSSGEVVWSGAFSSKSYTYNDAANESVNALLKTVRFKSTSSKMKK